MIKLQRWKTISFNHPYTCRIELSNPSCLTAVCKRGSAEKVRYGIHMVVETFLLHICFIKCTLIIELI